MRSRGEGGFAGESIFSDSLAKATSAAVLLAPVAPGGELGSLSLASRGSDSPGSRAFSTPRRIAERVACRAVCTLFVLFVLHFSDSASRGVRFPVACRSFCSCRVALAKSLSWCARARVPRACAVLLPLASMVAPVLVLQDVRQLPGMRKAPGERAKAARKPRVSGRRGPFSLWPSAFSLCQLLALFSPRRSGGAIGGGCARWRSPVGFVPVALA